LPNQHPARAAAARTALFIALALQLGAGIHPGAALAAEPRVDSRQDAERLAPRQRIRLDEGWRFRLGDPDGQSAAYLYDIRPEVAQSADGKVADAMPEEAARVAKAGAAVLKPWILPSGNAFVLDPARRHVRPALEPAFDAPFAQPGFDDSRLARRAPAARLGDRRHLPRQRPVWRHGAPEDLGRGLVPQQARYPGGGPRQARLPRRRRRHVVRQRLDQRPPGRRLALWLQLLPHRPDALLELRRQPAGDPPRQSARIGALVSGRGPVPRRLADQDRAAARRPVGRAHRHAGGVGEVGQGGRWEVRLDNDAGAAAAAQVSTQLYVLDDAGRPQGAPVATVASPPTTLAAGASATVSASATLARPRLWGPPPKQKPQRYLAVVTVRQDGRVVDRYETPFGIRAVRFDPDSGLVVNGQNVSSCTA
jgi:beta-galactosidase